MCSYGSGSGTPKTATRSEPTDRGVTMTTYTALKWWQPADDLTERSHPSSVSLQKKLTWTLPDRYANTKLGHPTFTSEGHCFVQKWCTPQNCPMKHGYQLGWRAGTTMASTSCAGTGEAIDQGLLSLIQLGIALMRQSEEIFTSVMAWVGSGGTDVSWVDGEELAKIKDTYVLIACWMNQGDWPIGCCD